MKKRKKKKQNWRKTFKFQILSQRIFSNELNVGCFLGRVGFWAENGALADDWLKPILINFCRLSVKYESVLDEQIPSSIRRSTIDNDFEQSRHSWNRLTAQASKAQVNHSACTTLDRVSLNSFLTHELFGRLEEAQSTSLKGYLIQIWC